VKNDQIIGIADDLRNILPVGEGFSDIRFDAMQGKPRHGVFTDLGSDGD
jgi:hypothetical protein